LLYNGDINMTFELGDIMERYIILSEDSAESRWINSDTY
jgi:hypothetical protein